MTVEDYMHYGWHKLYEWNRQVFADARKKSEEQFDALLDEREAARRKKMQAVQRGDGSLWDK